MKFILPIFVFTTLSLISFSQVNNQFLKECRISSGFGFASSTKDVKSIGSDIWIQLDYKVLENISIATEFENMTYTQPGYYPNLQGNNEIKVFNNNFSLLLKYHINPNKKLKVSVASGWTFSVRQNDYFIEQDNNNQPYYSRNISSFSDYRIPLLLELSYPICNTLNIETRFKYNWNDQYGNTYGSGLGLSLKL